MEVFILEYANKKNLKAILRWLLKKQDWSPFDKDPVEFSEMHFDFHPKTVKLLAARGGLCDATGADGVSLPRGIFETYDSDQDFGRD